MVFKIGSIKAEAGFGGQHNGDWCVSFWETRERAEEECQSRDIPIERISQEEQDTDAFPKVGVWYDFHGEL